MSLYCPSDEISLDALRRDVEGYSWSSLRQDLYSGISVALLTVPQAIAYALLAGLPLTCGLFAAIYSAILAACFGSSRHMVVGPSNALAILIQAGTSEILYTYYRDFTPPEQDIIAVQILIQLTLLTGLFQIVAAWARLGKLTQFISYSVILGYICGAALAMFVNQLFVFLGMQRELGITSVYESTLYLVSHLDQLELPTIFVGVGTLCIIIMLKRINPKIPAAVIALAIATFMVDILGLSSYSGSSWLVSHYIDDLAISNVLVIGDTGEIYDMLPSIGIPILNMRIINGVLPLACAIALLSVMESISVAKSIAASSGQRLSLNQEVLGVGLGNLLSSFMGAMPISGSPSRSNLNFSNGAQTRFSSVFSSLCVAAVMVVLGFFVTCIPLTSLAALLLVTALSMVKIKQVKLCIKTTRADAFVFWTTLLSCIFFTLDIAIYIGIALSITLYLKKAAIPHLLEYEIDDTGELRNLGSSQPTLHRMIRVIKVEGELFFGAADLFQTTLKTLAEDDTETSVIVLQLKNTRDIDATACLALQQLHEYLRGSGRYLIACGVTPPNWEVLSNSGLVEQIGEDNFFPFDERYPHLHMQRAILRAKSLVDGNGIVSTKTQKELSLSEATA